VKRLIICDGYQASTVSKSIFLPLYKAFEVEPGTIENRDRFKSTQCIVEQEYLL
jgi:hypothetical protein